MYSKDATSMYTEDTIKEIGDDMELENNDDKFNIEKTDTIDGLAYEQDTSSLLLLLTDGMDWSDMNRHLLLLQEKLSTRMSFVKLIMVTFTCVHFVGAAGRWFLPS